MKTTGKAECPVMTVGQLRNILRSLPSNMNLVSSSDDEGNSHGWVIFAPTLGEFQEDSGEFCDLVPIAESKVAVENNKFKDKFDKEINEMFAKFKGEPCLCIN